MKLSHPDITNVLKLSDRQINVLIIESPYVFYKLIVDIKKQIDNLDGNAVLSINDKPVSFHKYADILTDMVSVELNDRKILSKVIMELENRSMDDLYYERTQLLISRIEAYINELCLDYDAVLECETITFQHILKAAGIKIEDNYTGLSDRIYAYMELVREFIGDKLFILVNFSSYVDNQELQAFANTVIDHAYKVLLIDSHDFDKLNNESRLVIDCDLCEF